MAKNKPWSWQFDPLSDKAVEITYEGQGKKKIVVAASSLQNAEVLVKLLNNRETIRVVLKNLVEHLASVELGKWLDNAAGQEAKRVLAEGD